MPPEATMPRTLPSIPAGPPFGLRRWLLAGGLAVPLLVGCGSERYEQRLQETVTYFEYKDRINRELGREWSGQGVSLRPPRQFKLNPLPAPETGEGNQNAVLIDASADPRQPHRLGIELPGLLAAWETEVDADTGDSQFGQSAFLYVLSNSGRYLQQQDGLGDGADPQSFLADVENSVSRVIGKEDG